MLTERRLRWERSQSTGLERAPKVGWIHPPKQNVAPPTSLGCPIPHPCYCDCWPQRTGRSTEGPRPVGCENVPHCPSLVGAVGAASDRTSRPQHLMQGKRTPTRVVAAELIVPLPFHFSCCCCSCCSSQPSRFGWIAAEIWKTFSRGSAPWLVLCGAVTEPPKDVVGSQRHKKNHRASEREMCIYIYMCVSECVRCVNIYVYIYMCVWCV